VYDPASIRHLEALGSMEGWRCLEVGAGAGSIAAWLSQQVGPQGTIVASDLDLRFLDELRIPNLQVLRHDIAKEDLSESSLDLIHSRLLIHLLPAREKVLAKLASALKPGEWLLCEVFDFNGGSRRAGS
jgi:ubiquinone/menaquinone biosynthesis C-methylase UbiE